MVIIGKHSYEGGGFCCSSALCLYHIIFIFDIGLLKYVIRQLAFSIFSFLKSFFQCKISASTNPSPDLGSKGLWQIPAWQIPGWENGCFPHLIQVWYELHTFYKTVIKILLRYYYTHSSVEIYHTHLLYVCISWILCVCFLSVDTFLLHLARFNPPL